MSAWSLWYAARAAPPASMSSATSLRFAARIQFVNTLAATTRSPVATGPTRTSGRFGGSPGWTGVPGHLATADRRQAAMAGSPSAIQPQLLTCSSSLWFVRQDSAARWKATSSPPASGITRSRVCSQDGDLSRGGYRVMAAWLRACRPDSRRWVRCPLSAVSSPSLRSRWPWRPLGDHNLIVDGDCQRDICSAGLHFEQRARSQ
jgi:hypothetical protein